MFSECESPNLDPVDLSEGSRSVGLSRFLEIEELLWRHYLSSADGGCTPAWIFNKPSNLPNWYNKHFTAVDTCGKG